MLFYDNETDNRHENERPYRPDASFREGTVWSVCYPDSSHGYSSWALHWNEVDGHHLVPVIGWSPAVSTDSCYLRDHGCHPLRLSATSHLMVWLLVFRQFHFWHCLWVADGVFSDVSANSSGVRLAPESRYLANVITELSKLERITKYAKSRSIFLMTSFLLSLIDVHRKAS